MAALVSHTESDYRLRCYGRVLQRVARATLCILVTVVDRGSNNIAFSVTMGVSK